MTIKITPEEKQLLIQLRDRYIALYGNRAKNPADFSINIAALKELDIITKAYLQLIRPYHIKSQAANAMIGNHDCNRFALFSVKRTATAYSKLEKEMHDFLYPAAINDLVRLQLAEEPRIKSISTPVTDVDTTLSNQFGISERSHSQTTNFIILFSDNTELSLSSLEDKHILADGKAKFESKMSELAMKYQSTNTASTMK